MTGDEIVPGMDEPLDVNLDTEPAATAAPAAPALRRGGKRTAVVTLVALGVAAGGGAIALAAGGHGTGTAGPRGAAGGPGGLGGYGGFGGPGGPGGPGNAPPGASGTEGGSGAAPGGASGATGYGNAPMGRGRTGLPGGGIVHGTFVVPEGSSSASTGTGTGTETDDVQRGTVSAVSGDAITVASADGFTKDYTLDSSSKVDGGQGSVSDVKTGDTVSLVATESGDTATVTTLLDQSQAKKPAATSSPTAAPDSGGPGGRGPGGFPGGGVGGGDDLALRALHGTFVVATRTGTTTTTYLTDVVQTGDVTALSATSISLRSTDGYTATYILGAATKKDSSVATGKDATVIATGSPATATTVRTPGMRGSGNGPASGGPGGWGGGSESGSDGQPPSGGSSYGGVGGPGGPPAGSRTTT